MKIKKYLKVSTILLKNLILWELYIKKKAKIKSDDGV